MRKLDPEWSQHDLRRVSTIAYGPSQSAEIADQLYTRDQSSDEDSGGLEKVTAAGSEPRLVRSRKYAQKGTTVAALNKARTSNAVQRAPQP